MYFSLFCGGFWVGLFCVLFGFVVLVLVLISNCLIPFSSHKSCGVFQVSVEGHWTYSPGLMSWCAEYLYSLTWTAGILEICCSLRGKKNLEMYFSLMMVVREC